MESDTFMPGKGSGAMYGKGLYTIYEPPTGGSGPTFAGSYGDYLYKIKVNLDGFLILDTDVCEKVHGKPLSLKQQLIKMGREDIYSRLKKDWPDLERIEWKQQGLTFEHFFDRERLVLDYTSDLAISIRDYVANNIAGLIFTGRQDGKVCVIYDPSTCVVVGVSNYLDTDEEEGTYEVGQRKFRPIKPGTSQIQRSAMGEINPARHATKNKKSLEIIVKAFKSLGYKVDTTKLHLANSQFLDDNLMGQTTPTSDGSSPKISWKSAARNFMYEIVSRELVNPRPGYKDMPKIETKAADMAFPNG